MNDVEASKQAFASWNVECPHMFTIPSVPQAADGVVLEEAEAAAVAAALVEAKAQRDRVDMIHAEIIRCVKADIKVFRLTTGHVLYTIGEEPQAQALLDAAFAGPPDLEPDAYLTDSHFEQGAAGQQRKAETASNAASPAKEGRSAPLGIEALLATADESDTGAGAGVGKGKGKGTKNKAGSKVAKPPSGKPKEGQGGKAAAAPVPEPRVGAGVGAQLGSPGKKKKKKKKKKMDGDDVDDEEQQQQSRCATGNRKYFVAVRAGGLGGDLGWGDVGSSVSASLLKTVSALDPLLVKIGLAMERDLEEREAAVMEAARRADMAHKEALREQQRQRDAEEEAAAVNAAATATK
jgi:hypothetical protein